MRTRPIQSAIGKPQSFVAIGCRMLGRCCFSRSLVLSICMPAVLSLLSVQFLLAQPAIPICFENGTWDTIKTKAITLLETEYSDDLPPVEIAKFRNYFNNLDTASYARAVQIILKNDIGCAEIYSWDIIEFTGTGDTLANIYVIASTDDRSYAVSCKTRTGQCRFINNMEENYFESLADSWTMKAFPVGKWQNYLLWTTIRKVNGKQKMWVEEIISIKPCRLKQFHILEEVLSN